MADHAGAAGNLLQRSGKLIGQPGKLPDTAAGILCPAAHLSRNAADAFRAVLKRVHRRPDRGDHILLNDPESFNNQQNTGHKGGGADQQRRKINHRQVFLRLSRFLADNAVQPVDTRLRLAAVQRDIPIGGCVGFLRFAVGAIAD